jgi:hypothetical protein
MCFHRDYVSPTTPMPRWDMPGMFGSESIGIPKNPEFILKKVLVTPLPGLFHLRST